ncbi:MAG: UDP-glucose 4-epimerase GalE [Hyphomicrobiaceae bacterium]
MSVLVTGGAGYIGSHMAHLLRDKGEGVVVVDNLSTGFRQSVPQDAFFAEGDVADHALLGELITKHSVNAIIHFAGSVVVPDSVADPLGYYLNNTVKSRALIEAAVRHGVSHFIFSSTAAVYGAPEQNPVNEKSALLPVSPYGSSKLMTEMMLADTAVAHDFNFVALRYFNVAGADPSGRCGQSTPRATHLIKVACETALGARPHLAVFGRDYDTADGTCVRDYIHVSDLVRAHWDALNYLRGAGRSDVFNCGYSKGYSVLDVIDAVKRASADDFKIVEAERRAGDPPALVADSTKLRTTLGWQPELDSLDTIVEHALAWEHRLQSLRAT